MSRSSRSSSSILSVVVAGLLGGCTSILPGTPLPASGPSGQGKPAAGTSCARSAEPDVCLEWQDTRPVTGKALIAQANQDPVVAAQMLCSALPGGSWDRFLGAGHYRVIAQGPVCTISSDDLKKTADGNYEPVMEVNIWLSPKDTIAGDLAILNKREDTRAMVTTMTIAGKAAMRVGRPDDANGQGTDKEEISIAVADGDPGVLRIRQSMRPPRGKPNDSPIDRSKLETMRDPLIAELLKVLVP